MYWYFLQVSTFYDIFRKNTTVVLLKIGNNAFQHGPNIDEWQ